MYPIDVERSSEGAAPPVPPQLRSFFHAGRNALRAAVQRWWYAIGVVACALVRANLVVVVVVWEGGDVSNKQTRRSAQ